MDLNFGAENGAVSLNVKVTIQADAEEIGSWRRKGRNQYVHFERFL